MHLFPYASAITLSFAFPGDLSLAFILNFMQFTVKLSVEIMPYRIAFIFSEAVFHRYLQHANMLKSSMLIISFPSNLTTSFFMIALPILLTKVLFRSAVEDNLMLKERFVIPGTMMSSLPKFGNLTSSS